MIYLTQAPNDAELLPLLGNLAMLAPIPHGDINFYGRWFDNSNIRICGERKKLTSTTNDLLASIDTGRYMQQYRQAKEAGFDRFFLIVEGFFRPGQDGLLEIRRGDQWVPAKPAMMYRRVAIFLSEVANYLNVNVIRTRDTYESAQQILAQYYMFQEPPETHSSFAKFYTAPPPTLKLWGEPSLLRRMSKELDGIGWEISKAVEAHFGSVLTMANADVKQWQQVKGIGQKLALKAYEDIRKDEKRKEGGNGK